MDYKKVYISLIESRANLNRKKGGGDYFESHHIKPMCAGGTNQKNNLILLTAKEHFLAHLLLVEMYANTPYYHKMVFALNCMRICSKHNKNRNNRIMSARQFERIKKMVADSFSATTKGRPKSEEHKAKLRGKIKSQEEIKRTLETRVANGNLYHTEATKAIIKEKRKLQKIDGQKILASRLRNGTNSRTEDQKKMFREMHPSKLPVSMYNCNSEWLGDFPSLVAAAGSIGVNVATVCDNLKGRSKFVSKKYQFKYKNAS